MQVIEKKGFYYLRFNYRKGKEVITKEKYLGNSIPSDIEMIKEKFLKECQSQTIYKKFKTIKKNFQKECAKYPESVKKKRLIDLSVEFTYNSNAIEGSTITLDETEELIKRQISPHKPFKDVQETISHSRVFLNALTQKKLSLQSLLNWHGKIFIETKPDIAGKIRDYHVRVGPYRAPDWQDVEKLLKEFIKWYNISEKMIPVERAARAHYKFEKIHPFGDGNGRIGRIIIAQILKTGKYPPVMIEYKKRKSYYHALNASEEKFVQYFFRRYIAFNKEYLTTNSTPSPHSHAFSTRIRQRATHKKT